MKIVKSLEDSSLSIKGVNKTFKNESKEQNRGCLSMLGGTLGVCLLVNLLTGKIFPFLMSMQWLTIKKLNQKYLPLRFPWLGEVILDGGFQSYLTDKTEFRYYNKSNTSVWFIITSGHSFICLARSQKYLSLDVL